MSALSDRCFDAGLSIRGLARSIGIHPSCVELWVKGRRPIPPARVGAVCEALGCRPSDLLGPEPTFPPFAYSPVRWFPEQTCILCGTPVDARLRCPRCRRAVA